MIETSLASKTCYELEFGVYSLKTTIKEALETLRGKLLLRAQESATSLYYPQIFSQLCYLEELSASCSFDFWRDIYAHVIPERQDDLCERQIRETLLMRNVREIAQKIFEEEKKRVNRILSQRLQSSLRKDNPSLAKRPDETNRNFWFSLFTSLTGQRPCKGFCSREDIIWDFLLLSQNAMEVFDQHCYPNYN